jgi:hypothetical protein
MPKLTDYNKKRLERFRGDQWLVITRAQAIACGMPRSTIGNMIREQGPWQVLLPGVYLTVTGAVTQEQREVAALLYAGSKGIITGLCAVRRHRIASPGPNTVDVLVPMTVRRKSTGFVRLHRTERLPENNLTSGALRFACAARAVADAARHMSDIDDVRTVVYGAIQHKVCEASELITELREGPTQRCSLLRLVLAEIATGIRSHAENDLRLLIRKGRVPEPTYNAKLYTLDGVFIAMVDAWWDRAGVAVEVDSREYHTDHKAQDKDRNRHDMLITYGVFPLHFSPYRIQHAGDGVLRDIRGGLAQGENRPRLPIIALPADAEWSEEWAARARAMAASLAA